MAGRVGRKRELGRGWKRKEGEVRWAAGLGWAGGGLARLDRFCFFFLFFLFFFSNPFQTNFSNLFKSNFHTNFSNNF
jgi:hypothetical protein